jgi:hypothetical protein
VAHWERTGRLSDRAKIAGVVRKFHKVAFNDLPDPSFEHFWKNMFGTGLMYAVLLQIETAGMRRTHAKDWRFSAALNDGKDVYCTFVDTDWASPVFPAKER